ncbi:unnamed protein product, partial [Meganyctiphanes norvegica]
VSELGRMGPPRYMSHRQGTSSCPESDTLDHETESGSNTSGQTSSKRKGRSRIRRISTGSRSCSKSRSSPVPSTTLAELFRSIQQDVKSQYQDQLVDNNPQDIDMEGPDDEQTNNSYEEDEDDEDDSQVHGPAPLWNKFPEEQDIPIGFGVEDELFASAVHDLVIPISPIKRPVSTPPIPPVNIIVTASEAFEHGTYESSDDEEEQETSRDFQSLQDDSIMKNINLTNLEDEIQESLTGNSELLSNLVFVSDNDLVESDTSILDKGSEKILSHDEKTQIDDDKKHDEKTQIDDDKSKSVIRTQDISLIDEINKLQGEMTDS